MPPGFPDGLRRTAKRFVKEYRSQLRTFEEEYEVNDAVDIGDFSYADAAQILEIPIGTVMSRLYRGRKLLEKTLLKYARHHGYIRGGEPTKMRTRPKSPAA